MLKTETQILRVLRSGRRTLDRIPEELRACAACVEASRWHGTALERVSARRETKMACLQAVMQDGTALRFGPPRRCSDFLCFEDVMQAPHALELVPAVKWLRMRLVLRAAGGEENWLQKEIQGALARFGGDVQFFWRKRRPRSGWRGRNRAGAGSGEGGGL